MELVQLQVPGASGRSRLARAARAAPAPSTVSGWQGSDRLPAASPASVCKPEFQPALQKTGEANPGHIYPLGKEKSLCAAEL